MPLAGGFGANFGIGTDRRYWDRSSFYELNNIIQGDEVSDVDDFSNIFLCPGMNSLDSFRDYSGDGVVRTGYFITTWGFDQLGRSGGWSPYETTPPRRVTDDDSQQYGNRPFVPIMAADVVIYREDLQTWYGNHFADVFDSDQNFSSITGGNSLYLDGSVRWANHNQLQYFISWSNRQQYYRDNE